MTRCDLRVVLKHRLTRFAAVGAIGIVVQLAVLAILLAMKIEYLLATALAVEAAVIHNFIWHRHFTWSDRPQKGWSALLKRLFRFHVSNGVVSLFGNLVMMRLLVGWLAWPAVIANLVSISTCFVVNFLASELWVFSIRKAADETTLPPYQVDFLERSRMRTSVRCAKGT